MTTTRSDRSGAVRRLVADFGSPIQVIAVSFVGLIAAGTVLLSLPVAHAGSRVGVVDALFTATSAVCVTGLAVVDTGSAYSGFGQVVVLVLFQLGGLGLLTFGTFLALATGRQLGYGERIRMQHQLSASNVGGVVSLATTIARVVVTSELIGALLLYSRFSAEEGVGRGAWFAVFHSVSAFNNAGFSLYPDSLGRYVQDPVVSVTVMILIVVGGLGFVVITNLGDVAAARRAGKRVRASLHTKVVLAVTAFLIAAGTALVLLVESNNDETLRPLSAPGRVLAALFQSVTSRTAGFNSIDIGSMTTAGLLLTMLLMFIGGNPGSTAGGIKTTTFFVIVASIWSVVRGRPDSVVLGRRLGADTVVRAGAVGASAVLLIGAAATLLAVFEPDVALEDLLFETVSALGTVGLSTGITPSLGNAGKAILIVLMYVGRIGLLSFALALVKRSRTATLRHPAEDLVVG